MPALVLAAAAVLGAASWLRDPRELYLALVGVATALAIGATLGARQGEATGGRRAPRSLVAPVAFGVVAALFLGSAWTTQRALHALDVDGEGVMRRAHAAAGAALDAGVATLAGEADTLASAALDALLDMPEDPILGAGGVPARRQLFARLATLVDGTPDRAVVVFRRGVPLAWAGALRLHPDSLPAGARCPPRSALGCPPRGRGVGRRPGRGDRAGARVEAGGHARRPTRPRGRAARRRAQLRVRDGERRRPAGRRARRRA